MNVEDGTSVYYESCWESAGRPTSVHETEPLLFVESINRGSSPFLQSEELGEGDEDEEEDEIPMLVFVRFLR